MSPQTSTAGASAMEPQVFRRICGKFATGITITTVRGPDGTPHGLTANSFTSVSLKPPLILLCLDHRANIIEHFKACCHFGINVLNENQRRLSEAFARVGQDRFRGVRWFEGETGVPLLHDVLATFECVVERSVTVGDHDLLIGEVLHGSYRDGNPLLYFGGNYRLLDKTNEERLPYLIEL